MKHLRKILMPCAIMISFVAVQSFKIKTTEPSARKNSIEFVKAEGDQLLFKTDLQNLPAGGCELMIKDTEGNTIFTEKISGGIHQKLYRINREAMNGLYFEVRSKKFLFKESFDFKTKVQETFSVVKAA